MFDTFIPNAQSGYSRRDDQTIINLEDRFGAHHYQRLDMVVRQARGCWLTDQKGRTVLDCLAAYSAANPGHHHPRIVEALVSALNGNYGSVVSNVVYTDALAVFLDKVANLAPQLAPRFGRHGNKALLKNGGVESVETAIKAARYYGWQAKGIEDGKQEIIVFDRNFHGRMVTVISFSSTEKYRRGFGPLTPGFVSAPFGDLEAVELAVSPNTCGILVEPMQGEGGMNVPPPGFLKGLRSIADRHDLLLLFDEIQVGLGRTGKTFCFEHEAVVPDGLILGKALSGGLVPLSAFIANTRIMDLVFKPGSDGSTYGGYPLACVAGVAALEVLKEENLAQRSALQGKKLIRRLEEIASRSPYVKEVRGKGLFIGIEMHNGRAMDYCRKLLDLGVLANDSHGTTIRISPPLIIGDDELDYLCDRIENVLID
ncbi:MAG: aspartate aminotransferase family protein [Desulfobacteraceae bacterium]